MALDFGSTIQGTSSPAQTVTVTTSGQALSVARGKRRSSIYRQWILERSHREPRVFHERSNFLVRCRRGCLRRRVVPDFRRAAAAVGEFGRNCHRSDFHCGCNFPHAALRLAGSTLPGNAYRIRRVRVLQLASSGRFCLPSGLSLSAAGGPYRDGRFFRGGRQPFFSVQLTDSASHTTTAQLTLPVALASTQANCNDMEYPNSSTPNVPLTDLGTGTYMGEEGGLYPDGSNVRPPGQDAAGVAIAQAIRPWIPTEITIQMANTFCCPSVCRRRNKSSRSLPATPAPTLPPIRT